MLKGRLGLETARVPHADRHGLVWLARGRLYVVDGTLRFATVGWDDLPAGDYAIPFQMLSGILMQPGTTVSHDALRLLARHGTALVAVGEDGIRFYAGMPFGPDDSRLAREQARCWADEGGRRLEVARRMYAWRLGEVFPDSEISVLRGIEGARMKETYVRIAQQFGIEWRGRRYDRANPEAADEPNQAINHAATAVEAAAMIAVAVTGTLPQLGFIHEDSGNAFCLDIADLHRDSVTLPVAFGAVGTPRTGVETLERVVRRLAGKAFRTQRLIPKMIEQIKELFPVRGGSCEAGAPPTDVEPMTA
ncbi:MAG: type I-E CRISPR-associated endonuclease Cas1 [Candidatus Riflebacteria bacterium]|nr:type I-E CRISPR-associated endonuclease Cas1 [Candidatus Riflebacteria bacterium]